MSYCCIYNANQSQVRNRRYPLLATTWTEIVLAKFRHVARFQPVQPGLLAGATQLEFKKTGTDSGADE
jgi:hypothetical protein